MITFLDHTCLSPEENLACDEALLDLAEEGRTGPHLRFWEADKYFVVLGSSNRVELEVNVDSCHRDDVPILRRHSGGGAVLQGPGCLSYCLILPVTGPFITIPSTNTTVLSRHRELLEPVVGRKLSVAGLSDLAVAHRKFSGNSQRRRLRYLMFHGTFLLDFDLGMIEDYLRLPSRQPQYRMGRSHIDFLTNLHVSADAVRSALRSGWSATTTDSVVPTRKIEELVQRRYGLKEWNYRL